MKIKSRPVREEIFCRIPRCRSFVSGVRSSLRFSFMVAIKDIYSEEIGRGRRRTINSPHSRLEHANGRAYQSQSQTQSQTPMWPTSFLKEQSGSQKSTEQHRRPAQTLAHTYSHISSSQNGSHRTLHAHSSRLDIPPHRRIFLPHRTAQTSRPECSLRTRRVDAPREFEATAPINQ
jgi:hypothetical protein